MFGADGGGKAEGNEKFGGERFGDCVSCREVVYKRFALHREGFCDEFVKATVGGRGGIEVDTDYRAVHVRRGSKAIAFYNAGYACLAAKRDGNRERAVIAFFGGGAYTLGDFLLYHNGNGRRFVFAFEKSKQQRRRNVIRQICDDLVVAAGKVVEFGIRPFSNVVHNYFDVVKPRERFVKYRRQRRIDFKRDYATCRFGKRTGKRARSRTDFQSGIAARYASVGHYRAEQGDQRVPPQVSFLP